MRLARIAAALLVCASALSPALHVDSDDPFCLPGSSQGGNGAAVSASPQASEQHCEVCHWLRSLRTLDATDAGLTTGLGVQAAPSPSDCAAGDPPALAARSCRAPPLA